MAGVEQVQGLRMGLANRIPRGDVCEGTQGSCGYPVGRGLDRDPSTEEADGVNAVAALSTGVITCGSGARKHLPLRNGDRKVGTTLRGGVEVTIVGDGEICNAVAYRDCKALVPGRSSEGGVDHRRFGVGIQRGVQAR